MHSVSAAPRPRNRDDTADAAEPRKARPRKGVPGCRVRRIARDRGIVGGRAGALWGAGLWDRVEGYTRFIQSPSPDRARKPGERARVRRPRKRDRVGRFVRQRRTARKGFTGRNRGPSIRGLEYRAAGRAASRRGKLERKQSFLFSS